MNNLYFSQPVLSNLDIVNVLKKVGLDFAAWPQSKLPDACVALQISQETDYVKNRDEVSKQQVIAGVMQRTSAPHPIIRTSWGLLIGERYLIEPEADGLQKACCRVEVQYEKGWDDERLGFYCDAAIELLDESAFLYKELNPGSSVTIDESVWDGLLNISTTFIVSDDKSDEKRASYEMLMYLIEIFKNGILDNVIKIACDDKSDDTMSAELMLGLRPDLLDRAV